MTMRLYPLLLPAFLLMLLPSQAHAAPSQLCAQLESLTPVSTHYTQEVLVRAEKGLAYARQAPASSDFARYAPAWAVTIGSAWAGLLDAQTQFTFEERELPQVTACLHIDLMLIDCKMDKVRDELRNQMTIGSSNGIHRLVSLLSFLDERRRHLQFGALDPLYTDPTMGDQYSFDPPVASSEQSDDEKILFCPFDADYAPALPSGFGCDIETMQPFTDYQPVQAELDALTIISQQVKEYQDAARAFLGVQQKIDELFGNTSVAPAPPAERKHLNAFGCGWNAGYCSGKPLKRCTVNKDCGGDGSCEQATKTCNGNRAVSCNSDEQCGSNGPCVDNVEIPDVRALRGPFSLKKDQISILTEFLGLRAAQEISREYRDDLKTSEEFSDPAMQKERAAEEESPLYALSRNSYRMTVRVWSRIQGREEARIFPETVDAQLEIAKALTGLRTAVSTLSTLSSGRFGLRQFVIDYARFLQDSCIHRPCGGLLSRVVSIATTDACFPYTNGEYLGDTPENPRWKQCEDAAGIVNEQ